MLNPASAKLTAEEVCTILKACADAGVSELAFQGLRVKFGRDVQPLPQEPLIPMRVREAQEERTNEAIQQDEEEARNLFLDELKISDPEEYERQVHLGNLQTSKAGEVDGEEDPS